MNNKMDSLAALASDLERFMAYFTPRAVVQNRRVWQAAVRAALFIPFWLLFWQMPLLVILIRWLLSKKVRTL